MEKQLPRMRSWDALPSAALVNIFCRTPIKDRIHNLPLVCKTWADACRHPLCWASMSSDSHRSSTSAFDDAFVKDSFPYASAFLDPFDGRRSADPSRGVLKLQTLIARAGGGATATSLYVFPFLTSVNGSPNDDALLCLIARYCPNLRHLSFHGSQHATEGAILEAMRRCWNLELVDFSESPYFNATVLQEMSISCPNLRGIRRNGVLEPSSLAALIAGFPNLRLLNLSNSTIVDKDLLNIVTRRAELQYLDITNCERLLYHMYIIKGVLDRIDLILYD